MTLKTVMYKVGCEAGDDVEGDVDGDDVKDDVNDQDVSISLPSYFHES